MLLGELLVNSRPLVVKILWSQKLFTDFQLHAGGRLVPLTPLLLKGQLYILFLLDLTERKSIIIKRQYPYV